jgi:hypothetical protein
MIQYIKDAFYDNLGQVHYFIVLGLSIPLTPTSIATNDPIIKGLAIGVSVCHPKDSFNLDIGIKKALEDAKNKGISIFTTKSGLINTDTVDAILRKEALYIERNPGSVIPGYKEMQAKMLKKKDSLRKFDKLTPEEKQAINVVSNSSYILKNLKEFINIK